MCRRPHRRALPCLVGVLAAAALAWLAPSAPASPHLQLGLMDDAYTLGAPRRTFPVLGELGVQVVRMSLVWGGPGGVANTRPQDPRDPADPAYRWERYDRAVEAASAEGIRVLLTIVGTPRWANGGGPPRRAPSSAKALRDFAYAAANRYSGGYHDASGTALPPVKLWLAWNEPNNPVFLAPQYRRIRGRWVPVAAGAYARICTAVYDGVHAAAPGEQVGCGATAPRGNDDPAGSRPSIAPLAFLRDVRAAGLRRFDAWAHHPYPLVRLQTPTSRPRGGEAVEVGNIGSLIGLLTRLYGPRRVWITEYGYQTDPPDRFFGVSWAAQAGYLREAYLIARRNPRIDLFTWFLLQDERPIGGWQSGLISASGRRKPAFAAFERLGG
jgi:hypothetical protein